MRTRSLFAIAVVVVGAFAMTGSMPVSAAMPQRVTIHTIRDANGDVWSSSGAFVDAGTMADASDHFGGPSTFHTFRTFTGDEGTFMMRADVVITPTADPNVLAVNGRWSVVSGTGA